MRLSARDQIIVGVALIVLFAVAFFFLLIMPRFGEIAELESRLEQVQADTVAAETLVAQRQDAKAAAAETQVELLDIASRFPEAPELPSLIIELQDAANRAEIDFIRLAPGTPEKVQGNTNVTAIPLTVQISGTWNDFIDFLEEIEDLRREIRITQWSVASVPPEIQVDEEGNITGGAEGAEGAEGGGGTGLSIEDVDPEDLMYTIDASLSLEAYMMEAQLTGGGGGEGQQGAPSQP